MAMAMNLESEDVVAGDLLAGLGEGRPISWLKQQLKENLSRMINYQYQCCGLGEGCPISWLKH